MADPSGGRREFAFRPWVRRSCGRAMLWGIGLLAILGVVTWWLRAPGAAPLGRAFGVLALYAGLFWLTLLKVWWTAGKAAVVITPEQLGYQPLHRFGPRMIPFAHIVFCGPRPATHSLRVIHQGRAGRPRELFLNLGVIDGRHELLEVMGERLRGAGLEAAPCQPHTWCRPGWELAGSEGEVPPAERPSGE